LTKDTAILSFIGNKAKLVDQLKIKEGQKISIETFPAMNPGYSAYECGCWLVKDGKVIVPDYDPWIGVLTNHDPRTAVGVKSDGRVILLVVDGRQPGYSTGFTGKELAQYLVQNGVKDAAMLDGGASSQIFVNGSLKSRPSYMGIERPLGGGLFIKIKNK
jgi:exopolysaccharide biosynthesis protein